jgi:hypothetical protein
MFSLLMMAVGGFYGPQTVTHLARQTDADLNTVTDNAPASHDQTGCGLLLVCSVGDSSGYLVEGTAGLHDWQTISD